MWYNLRLTVPLLPPANGLQERNQQLVDELYAAHGHLGFSRNFFMKVRHN
jgi:uncharacterized membrane protein affecting hemolysin expression